jgi:hypothetical protein
MLITGVTNCGKTYFVLDLIEKYYLDKFNYILIICPTYFFNTTYERKWIFKDPRVLIINPDSVKNNLNDTLMLMQKVFQGAKTLLIIDDCANLADSKKKISELCHLAFSGRHYNFTIWIINQKYNSVVKDFRENIRMLVLFFNKDENSTKQALEENDIVPKEMRKEIIDKLKDKKGSKLILRLQYPFDYIIV